MTQPHPIQRELFPGRERLPVPASPRVCPPSVRLGRILHRRWRFALAVFLVTCLGAWLTLLLLPSWYVATATVQFDDPLLLTPGASVSLVSAADPRGLHTLEWQFDSRETAARVVRQLNLQQPLLHSGRLTPQQAARAATDDLLAHLEADPVRNSRVLLLRYRATSAAQAARVVNAVTAAARARLLQQRRQRIQTARHLLAAQLQRESTRLQAVRARLRAFAAAHPEIAFASPSTADFLPGTSRLRALQSAQIQAEIKADQQRSRLQLQSASPAAAPVSLAGELPAQLLLRRTDLESRLRRLSAQYVPSALPLVQARRELDAVNQSLLQYQDALRQRNRQQWQLSRLWMDRLGLAIRRQGRAAAARQDLFEQFADLRRQASLHVSVCDSLRQQLEQLTVAHNATTAPVRIVEPAVPPTTPARPRPALSLVAAVLAGLFIAPGATLLRDRFDARVEPGDWPDLGTRLLAVLSEPPPPSADAFPAAADSARFSVSGTLPAASTVRNGPPPIASLDATDDTDDEMDALLATLYDSARRYGTRVLLVTGPGAGENRGASAVSIARALALTGEPVLVIDSDFRQPRVHACAASPDAPGLAEFLTGQCTLQTSVHFAPAGQWPRSLCVLPAGAPSLSPVQLLALPAVEELLRAARRQYSWVVIACGAVLPSSGIRLLVDLADASLLVVPSVHPSAPPVGRSMDHLRDWKAPLLGVVAVVRHRHPPAGAPAGSPPPARSAARA